MSRSERRIYFFVFVSFWPSTSREIRAAGTQQKQDKRVHKDGQGDREEEEKRPGEWSGEAADAQGTWGAR